MLKNFPKLPYHLRWGYCRLCPAPKRIVVVNIDWNECAKCLFDLTEKEIENSRRKDDPSQKKLSDFEGILSF